MKRIIALLSLFVVFQSHAQTHPGFTVGGNFSNLTFDGLNVETTGRIGMDVGISFGGYYSEKFQTISEFHLFESGGANTVGRRKDFGTDLQTEFTDVELKLPSFSFSLIGNYFFFKENVGVQFGPYVKILNYGKDPYASNPIYLGDGDNSSEMINSSDVFDGMKKLDFGLSAGLSAGFNDFIFAVRYNYGLRNHDILLNGSPAATGSYNSISFGLSYFIKSVEILSPN